LDLTYGRKIKINFENLDYSKVTGVLCGKKTHRVTASEAWQSHPAVIASEAWQSHPAVIASEAWQSHRK